MSVIDTPKPLVLDFLDTTQSSQLITVKSNTESSSKSSINPLVASSEDVWRNKGKLHLYQKGTFFGKGTTSNLLLSEFLKKFRKVLEEIIREELKESNQTSENYKDIFKALEATFNILIIYLEIMNIDLKDSKFLPIIHGFIDSYINSIINLERNG